MSIYTPQVLARDPSYIRKGASGTNRISIFDELTTEGCILIDSDITSETAVNTFAVMKHHAAGGDPLNFIIYSPGGGVTPGLSIYDMMQGYKGMIRTFCIGRAASMAAVLLAAGTPGERYILPNSEVMIHEVLTSGIGGSATSITRFCESINETKDIMNSILAKHTGRTVEEINKATSFDNYMNAEQAVEFGICDKIITDIFTEVQ